MANSDNELLSLSIYSSNGVLVREVPGSGTGVAWDGRNTSGNISKGGIYFYQLKVGSAVVKTGTVSLIR
ncbi:MAG: hypothetical protein WCI43_05085 [Candidatus Firestonebacteria bacterium]